MNASVTTAIVVCGAIILLIVGFVVVNPHDTGAAALIEISDLLSSSATSTVSNHTISFTTAGSVAAGGKIVMTPESGMYSTPVSLDHTDLDLSVNGVDRTLAALASATEDGVSVNSVTGVITITLNST